ncbi:hypothetical protein OESDEN_22536 [Oesophagostomum dentatum]|uniref:GIPC GH2 domain-containing protein n=1 Tax=Oesophagostomum dentatum TaxID=61180 RepID=A0A0B1RYS2_OESDE|nr:hypothetical protein OESDEN_22536 [Oesophagostomum dentatum]
MIKRLNEVLDSYLGVQDDQMAQALWDLALTCETLPELTKAVRESELSVFGFPDDLILDIWGILSDWRRELKKKNEKEEKEKQKVNILEDEEEQPLLPLI